MGVIIMFITSQTSNRAILHPLRLQLQDRHLILLRSALRSTSTRDLFLEVEETQYLI